MDGIQEPNQEREKEYRLLREKSEKIANCIKEAMGEEVSIFDLVCFSALTILQAGSLFPDSMPVFANVVRDCITLSIDAKISIDNGSNQVEEIKKKPLLFDSRGNEIK